jgi:cell division protein FtsW (lipid II flippase)
MIVLGLICLLIGFVAGIPILWTIGIILVVVGAILALIGSRRPADYSGRRWYY